MVTEYQRDVAGRLLVKTLADGEEIHYSYDALGRLVNVDDGHWPLAYEYDSQDRLITEHQGWGTLRYEYDNVGQLKHCRLPDGSKLDYRRLPGGHLSSIDLNGSRLTSHQFKAGREQQRQQGLLLSQYQYDDQGRLQAHNVSQRDSVLFQRRYVPKPMTSGAKADGRFNNDAFVYDAAKNEYICPAGEALIWHYSYVEKGLKLHRYWSSKCQGCALKLQCTPSTERRIRRWEHEDVLEEMQLRLSKHQR